MITYIKKKHAQHKQDAHHRAVMRTIYNIRDPKCRHEALEMASTTPLI